MAQTTSARTGKSALIHRLVLPLLCLAGATACAHNPTVRTEAYATHATEQTLEYEFPVVWKAIEDAVRNYHVVSRDPKDVDELEIRKITHRRLETDWILSESHNRYEEYKVNGSPRRLALPDHYRFRVDADSVMGGTHVSVGMDEEIQHIKPDGTGGTWEEVSKPDTSRANELLNKIHMAILSGA